VIIACSACGGGRDVADSNNRVVHFATDFIHHG
jgi:hypothetical protein